jgi:two-component system sensor histidine kinase EvgS
MNAAFKTYAPLYGVTLLVLLVAVLSFWSFRQTEAAAELRKHTYAVINRADALQSELTDAETGERGYLLTGNEAFLEPYLAVRDIIRDHLEELRSLP